MRGTDLPRALLSFALSSFSAPGKAAGDCRGAGRCYGYAGTCHWLQSLLLHTQRLGVSYKSMTLPFPIDRAVVVNSDSCQGSGVISTLVQNKAFVKCSSLSIKSIIIIIIIVLDYIYMVLVFVCHHVSGHSISKLSLPLSFKWAPDLFWFQGLCSLTLNLTENWDARPEGPKPRAKGKPWDKG